MSNNMTEVTTFCENNSKFRVRIEHANSVDNRDTKWTVGMIWHPRLIHQGLGHGALGYDVMHLGAKSSL